MNMRSGLSKETGLLESIGSSSPYEYSDDFEKKAQGGKFTINGAKAVVLK